MQPAGPGRQPWRRGKEIGSFGQAKVMGGRLSRTYRRRSDAPRPARRTRAGRRRTTWRAPQPRPGPCAPPPWRAGGRRTAPAPRRRPRIAPAVGGVSRAVPTVRVRGATHVGPRRGRQALVPHVRAVVRRRLHDPRQAAHARQPELPQQPPRPGPVPGRHHHRHLGEDARRGRGGRALRGARKADENPKHCEVPDRDLDGNFLAGYEQCQKHLK